MNSKSDRVLTPAEAKVNAYIDDMMVNGDPFYTTSGADRTNHRSVVNIKLSNHHPLGLAVFKIKREDGSTEKAFMRVADLTRCMGSICAQLELLGHKHIVHERLRFAMHGNTISHIPKNNSEPKKAA